MRNQFGQEINVGDWVGHVSRTGSQMTFRVGKVVRFGGRRTWWLGDPEPTVIAAWTTDVYGPSRGVGLDKVFKLDPAGLEP